MAISSALRWMATVAIFSTTLLVLMRPAFADVISFPQEELASESVLPVFDNPVSVKNRIVTMSHRFEIAPTIGYSLIEPFFNPLSVGLTASYNFNEVQGFSLLASYNMPGISGYAGQLNPIPPTQINANLQYAPAPKYLVLGNYQYNAFYGKISLSKEYVMNLSLYGLLGIGAIGIGDSVNPVVSVGLGQKFYFSNNWALRFDLREMVYQGPDVLSQPLDQKHSVQSSSYFSQTIQFGTLLSIGASYAL
jgi:outer membrane beta-barrel protein